MPAFHDALSAALNPELAGPSLREAYEYTMDASQAALLDGNVALARLYFEDAKRTLRAIERWGSRASSRRLMQEEP
jgi:hypothetical protein